jgi:WD40 repeat protein
MHRTSIAFSPDRTKLAWLHHQPQKGREGGGLVILFWDLKNDKELMDEIEPDSESTFASSALQFSPNGKMLALGCFEIITEVTCLGRVGTGLHNSIRFWSAVDGKEKIIVPHEKKYSHDIFQAIAFSKDGKSVTAVRSSSATVWNLPSGEKKSSATFKPVATWFSFSADGKFAAGHCVDKKVRVWQTDTGKEVFKTPSEMALGLSAEGSKLATLNGEKTVLWNAKSGKQLFSFPCKIAKSDRAFFRCAFTPNGKQLAWNEGGNIQVVDLATGKTKMTLQGEIGPLIFSPDSRRLAQACPNGTALVWDLAPKKK